MTVVFLSRPLDRHVEHTTRRRPPTSSPRSATTRAPTSRPARSRRRRSASAASRSRSRARCATPTARCCSDDTFPSRYIPEDAIYLIGKGGKLPAGQTLSGLYPGYTGSTAGIDLSTWLAKPAKKKKPAKDALPSGGAPTGTPGTVTGRHRSGTARPRRRIRRARRRPTRRRRPHRPVGPAALYVLT